MSFNENAYRTPTSNPSTSVNVKSIREGEKNNAGTKQKIVNKPQQNSLSLSKTGIMKRTLLKAENGAQQGGEQEQIQQLIMAFAEISQQDPQQIMQELQGMEQDQQQQAIQQMAQTVQQSQGQDQPQGQPQGQPAPEEQPQMRFGGPTHVMPDGTVMPGATHNPNAGAQAALDKMAYGGKTGAILFDGNTVDFNDVRKSLIKMYKKGGVTDESMLDTSSTAAYTDGLRKVFEQRMFTGNAIGKINDRFKGGQGAPQFQQLPPQMPMAKDGIFIDDNGTPTWDGEELTPYMKEKYGFTTLDELYAREDDYYDIIQDVNKNIFENSDYGKKAMEQGITFDQVNQHSENYTPEAQAQVNTIMAPFVEETKATAEAERIATEATAEKERIAEETNQAALAGVTDLDLQMHSKTRAEFDAMTPEEQQNLARDISGAAAKSEYVGPDGKVVDADGNVDTPPVVLTPAQEAEAETKRRAALSQAERDAEDKKNAEAEKEKNPYEKGIKYEWDGEKMVAVKTDGDASKGQANDPDRVKEGWNAQGTGLTNRRGLNSNFLNNIAGIVNRRQVGVQGNMAPEDFQNRLNQSGISDFKYKNNIFGEKVRIKFNPITGQQETVDEAGNVVDPNATPTANQPVSSIQTQPGQAVNDDDIVTATVDGRAVQMTAAEAENKGYVHSGNATKPTPVTADNSNPNYVNKRGALQPVEYRNRPFKESRRDLRRVGKEQARMDAEEQATRDNNYGNEIDATYDIAAANLRAKGITNPTKDQLNAALDNVEMVRGMSGVPAGERPPDFKYGGQAFFQPPLPKAKYGNNEEYQDVAKFKPLYETTIDFEKAADVGYEGVSKLNEFFMGMNTVMTPEEERAMQSTDRKFGTVAPDSGLEGWYDKQTGRQLPEDTGADVYAGRGGSDYLHDQEGQKFTQDLMGRSSNRMSYGLRDGGLIMAKAGLQVGQELILTPGQLKMMENLGYKVKQLY